MRASAVLLSALAATAFAGPNVTHPQTCDSCLVYNKDDCIQPVSCNGNFCLYEKFVSIDHQTSVRKTCQANDKYDFDDAGGITLTVNNRCVTWESIAGDTTVQMCNNGDGNIPCNRECKNPQKMPLNLTCYDCKTTDGRDCRTGSCQVVGYCTYVRKWSIVDKVTTLEKGCSESKQLTFDDGSVMTDVNRCVQKDTKLFQYSASLCDDPSYCNRICADW